MVALKTEIKRTCEVCGKTFIAKTLTSRYCSRRCTNIAYKRRKQEASEKKRLKEIADKVPDTRDFITVPEAVAIYAVSRDTLYRLIRQGELSCINLGQRLTRINRREIEKLFPVRVDQPKTTTEKKLYSLEPEDCYTIGEIAKKYHIHEDTVAAHIRRFSIPTRQIRNYVYAPKTEIDKIYKSL